MGGTKTCYTRTQQHLLDALSEAGALELCSLMNTVHVLQPEDGPDGAKRRFSKSLAGLWVGGVVTSPGLADWAAWGAQPGARHRPPPDLGRYVAWDAERGRWSSRLPWSEAPEVELTALGMRISDR